MLNKKDMDRINELSRKSKKESLTVEEKNEQKKLRDEYLSNFRKSFRGRLENITVVDTQEEYNQLIKEQNNSLKEDE